MQRCAFRRNFLARFHPRNIPRHLGCDASRPRPVNRISNYTLNFRLMINGIQLVAWAEIENPPCSTRPAAAAAQYIAAFEPRDEHQFLRFGDRERLAIHFAVWNLYELAEALRNLMRGIHHPQSFAFARFAPAERTRRSHQTLEKLRVMAGMQ